MGKQMLLMLLVVILLVAGGCATVVHGTRQVIPVNSNPQGAIVTESNSNQQIRTPGSFDLKRNKKVVLTARLSGYDAMTITLKPTGKILGATAGNILLGGIPGLIVDQVSGAAYELEPRSAFFNFEERMGALNCKCVKDYKSPRGTFKKGQYYYHIVKGGNYIVNINSERYVFPQARFKEIFEPSDGKDG